MEIIDVILNDHHEQRKLFLLIEQIDPSETDALAAIWERLKNLLEVHAEAEELHFYPTVLKVGTGASDAPSAEAETKDAIKDHNEIRDAARQVQNYDVGSKEWFAAVEKANKKNATHMAEEERQAMADFRQHASPEQRRQLALKFLAYEYHHLNGIKAKNDDPDEYVREHGGKVSEPA